MIKHAALATGLLLFAGVAAADGIPTLADSNGYKNCVNAAERGADFLRVDSTYYIKQEDGSRTYYLNGTGRTTDSSGRLRIACETDARGYNPTVVALESGRFVPRPAAGDVAAN